MPFLRRQQLNTARGSRLSKTFWPFFNGKNHLRPLKTDGAFSFICYRTRAFGPYLTVIQKAQKAQTPSNTFKRHIQTHLNTFKRI